MDDFSKEIMAYSLQNAIEFGKADPGRVLPKLFQHGLEKYQIRETMPVIVEIAKKVNSMSKKEREKEFEKHKSVVKIREHKEKDLDELPESNIKKKKVFRLAPFPSGALHLGNAKTYVLNALYAEKYDGDVILVMDDTIGSSKKPALKEGYELIESAFKWLDVKYKKPVIYKSKRIRTYYKYAKELIEKEKAYVCHCSQQEVRENRAAGKECSCRQFPSGIQLERWKEMFKAKEGEATLRLKTSMVHPNPAFRDRILFKISDREHPRVGKKYRVWPSLEMSWAIDDHLLGVTHIIRGNDLAMETEMEKYIWKIFKWKAPVVIHTGLINIETDGPKISKSKAQKEVLSGNYFGWNDPRTWSIQSLADRGISREAIREFVKSIGLNKQDITVPIESLYADNRKFLDQKAMRYSFVENPARITVDNTMSLKQVDVPVHPDTPHKIKQVPVGNKIFVSGKDFESYGGKEVRLLHLFNLKLEENTMVSSVENKKIPKLNWVSDGALKTKILMPNAKWIEGLAEKNIENIKEGDVVQFERFGFVKYHGKEKGFHVFWFAHK